MLVSFSRIRTRSSYAANDMTTTPPPLSAGLMTISRERVLSTSDRKPLRNSIERLWGALAGMHAAVAMTAIAAVAMSSERPLAGASSRERS